MPFIHKPDTCLIRMLNLCHNRTLLYMTKIFACNNAIMVDEKVDMCAIFFFCCSSIHLSSIVGRAYLCIRQCCRCVWPCLSANKWTDGWVFFMCHEQNRTFPSKYILFESIKSQKSKVNQNYYYKNNNKNHNDEKRCTVCRNVCEAYKIISERERLLYGFT